MQAEFKDCASVVIRFIHQSRHQLTIAVCWFTHPLIFEALESALRRGVKVRLALDHDQVNFNPKGLDFIGLEQQGVTIIAFTGPGLLHYKFAVADHAKVLNGSFNWTRTDQLDCLSIVDDARLAEQFETAFNSIQTQCKPLEQLRHTPARQVSFNMMYRPMAWTSHDLRKCIIAGAKSWVVVIADVSLWQNTLETQRHTLILPQKMPISALGSTWDADIFAQWLLRQNAPKSTLTVLHRYCIRIQKGDILIAALPNGTLLGVGVAASDPEWNDRDQYSRFVQWIACTRTDVVIELKPKIVVQSYKGSAMAVSAALDVRSAAFDNRSELIDLRSELT